MGEHNVPDGGVKQELIQVKSGGSSASYTWSIKGLLRSSELNILPNNIYSSVFEVEGVPWRLLFFPNGNGVRYLSLYLDLANAHALPAGWSRVACFSFTVVSKAKSVSSVLNKSENVFCLGLQDWGFRCFMPLSTLYDEEKGYIADDTLHIDFRITISPNEADDSDDGSITPRTSGAVGLCNQGATCYLNSLIQTWFHIPFLRSQIYHAPVGDGFDEASDDEFDDGLFAPLQYPSSELKEKNLVCALQQVFYNLQFQKKAVSTKELTAAFGWTQEGVFRQHDIHELIRVLYASLEEKLKGTKVSGTLDTLFKGVLVHTIACNEVDYESRTEEPFCDLQLNVKGCPTLYDALDKYFADEILEGDNKYATPDQGLQAATRKSILSKAPPVLLLHLKRFDFDIVTQKQTKVNERQEFPVNLNITPYLANPTQKDSDYVLLSVLVHSGDVNGGHYYSFLRPVLSGPWYRFDDERVIRVTEKDVVSENFGGDYGGGQLPRYSSAYVLIYLRVSDLDWLTPLITYANVPLSVHRRFGKVPKKDVEKDVAEAHLFINVQVITDRHILNQPDMTPPVSCTPIRYLRTTTLESLTNTLIKLHFNSETGEVVLWRWEERLNGTARPSTLVTQDPGATLEKVFSLGSHHKDVVILYAHPLPAKEDVLGAHTSVPPQRLFDATALILFLKVNVPEDGVCLIKKRCVVHKGAPLSTLVEDVFGYVVQQAQLYEEVRDGVLEELDIDLTVSEAELGNGDVIVVSSGNPVEVHPFATDTSSTSPQHQSVREVVKHRTLATRVKFYSVARPDVITATLHLSLDLTVADVKARLAKELDISYTLDLFASSVDYTPQIVPLPNCTFLGSALSLGWNKYRNIVYYSKSCRETQLHPQGSTTLTINIISSVHGELQKTVKVTVPPDALIGQLKTQLIEEVQILGKDFAMGVDFVCSLDGSEKGVDVKSECSATMPAQGTVCVPDKTVPNGCLKLHPHSDKVQLFEISTAYNMITQVFWDDHELVPEPAKGFVLCAEMSKSADLRNLRGSSFQLAPGLSTVSSYQISFDLTIKMPSFDQDRYLVQILHFETNNKDPSRTDINYNISDPSVKVIRAHSIPWLAVVHADDTVKAFRVRLLQDRPMHSALRDYVASSSKAPFHIVRSFNHCIIQPLAESEKLLPQLQANIKRRVTPALALHRPSTDKLRTNEGRKGPGICIRH